MQCLPMFNTMCTGFTPSKTVLAENCACLHKQLCRWCSGRPKILIVYGQKFRRTKVPSSGKWTMEKHATFLTPARTISTSIPGPISASMSGLISRTLAIEQPRLAAMLNGGVLGYIAEASYMPTESSKAVSRAAIKRRGVLTVKVGQPQYYLCCCC